MFQFFYILKCCKVDLLYQRFFVIVRTVKYIVAVINVKLYFVLNNTKNPSR